MVEENRGCVGRFEVLQVGVHLPRGGVAEVARLSLSHPDGNRSLVQSDESRS